MPYVKPKSNLGRIFGRTIIFGVVAEISVIVGGIYFFRKYHTDEEFRNQLVQDYPAAMEVATDVADMYRRTFDNVFSEETQAKIMNFIVPPATNENKPHSSNDK